MSVHNIGPGKWEVRFRKGGANRSKTIKGSKREALDYEAYVRRQILDGLPIPRRADNPLLEDFAAQWLTSKRRGLRKRTFRNYELLIDDHIAGPLGGYKLMELTPDEIAKWQERKLAEGAGLERITRAGRLLRQILDEAEQRELIVRNPARFLKAPPKKKKVIIPAEVEEVEAMRGYFLSKKRLSDATLITLMAYGGLRVGEAFGLDWSSVDGARIWIRHSLEDNGEVAPTKTGETRHIDLPSQAAADLNAWRLATEVPRGLIFGRASDEQGLTKDDRDNWRSRWCKKAATAAGLSNFPPKDLRHTSVSLRVAAGMSLADNAAYHGHSIEISVRNYQHIINAYQGKPVVPVEDRIALARSENVRSLTG
jgi:integrase